MNFSRMKKETAGAAWAVAFVLAASLAIGPATPSSAAKKPKPKTHIKFATVAPEGSTWMKIMHAFHDELRAET